MVMQAFSNLQEANPKIGANSSKVAAGAGGIESWECSTTKLVLHYRTKLVFVTGKNRCQEFVPDFMENAKANYKHRVLEPEKAENSCGPADKIQVPAIYQRSYANFANKKKTKK